MNIKANCYAIASSLPFLDILSDWLIDQYGQNPLSMADVLVLLPNRRSCRSLREALLKQSQGRPLILPRICSIGDMGEAGAEILPQLIPAAPQLTMLSPTKRQMMLTRLVFAAQKGEKDVSQAAEMARELIKFMDEVTRHRLNLDSLSQLVPENLSLYWQRTLDFLKLISMHWPALLSEAGAVDPMVYRNQQIEELANYWKEHPPSYPVIAAGSTGSQPATAKLLGVIARSANGRLVLAGLDNKMPSKEWNQLSPTHPQYGLKQLLDCIEVARENIPPIPGYEMKSARSDLWRAVFAPADVTAEWYRIGHNHANGCSGLAVVTADTQAEEAKMISVLLRETLEIPGKTAALVTPDRSLAKMVRAQMQRFGVELDDSAGISLLDTPVGVFMRLVCECVQSDFSPVSLLAMLRHPLAALGKDTAQCRATASILEKQQLRGLRRVQSLPEMAAACRDAGVSCLLEALHQAALDLHAALSKPEISFSEMLLLHVACCEALAATSEESGAQRLWARESGRMMSASISELLTASLDLPSITPSSYGGLLSSLLAELTVRPAYGLHPRLSILSPIEARLQSYDRVILSGLNEGIWPSIPAPSPWMSRPMKKAFGFPSPQLAIGQSAHDFVRLASSDEVFLTHARKVEGTPQVSSRWLVRLQTYVEGNSPELWQSMQATDRIRALVRSMDSPLATPGLKKPRPVPPLSSRPDSLSTSAIEKLTRDPYASYAETILKLRALDPLEEEPSAKHFGQLIHRALEQFSARYPARLPEDLAAGLRECGEMAFAEMIDRPAVNALWWPRFESLIDWLAEQERQQRAISRLTLAERKGRWQMDIDGQPFTLTARIDRLDYLHDGSLAIVDYKTGSIPTDSELRRAEVNQLALYALCLCHGAFENLPPEVMIPKEYDRLALYYWKLGSTPDQCINQQLITDVALVKKNVEALVRRYRNPEVCYESHDDPSVALSFNPYEHLSRRKEWDSV